MNETLLDRVNKKLFQLGKKRPWLAEVARVPKETINSWFKREGVVPRAGALFRVAAALGTTVEYLVLGGNENAPRESRVRRRLSAWIAERTDAELETIEIGLESFGVELPQQERVSPRDLSSRNSGAVEYGRMVEIADYGPIAAGAPIETDVEFGARILVPATHVQGDPEHHYALHVRGWSMVDAGIDDGDIVVMRKQGNAHTGEIVAVRLDEVVTLKKYFVSEDKRSFIFLPCNHDIGPIVVREGHYGTFRIEGVAMGRYKPRADRLHENQAAEAPGIFLRNFKNRY